MTSILPRPSEVGNWLWTLLGAGLAHLWWIALAALVVPRS
ncbi:hypothetical protein T261_0114 [Streptomyces lydicus]|nr:hypothetical protein T261_0114 [Streptomyces lydicus]